MIEYPSFASSVLLRKKLVYSFESHSCRGDWSTGLYDLNICYLMLLLLQKKEW